MEVIRKISNQKSYQFKFIAINGLKLAQPKLIYKNLARELFGLDFSIEQACKVLGKHHLNQKTTS